MICVGIDVAKDKHDCVILNSEGKVLSLIHISFNARVSLTLPVCHRPQAATLALRSGAAVSYTHLDVYKRQDWNRQPVR